MWSRSACRARGGEGRCGQGQHARGGEGRCGQGQHAQVLGGEKLIIRCGQQRQQI